MVTGEGRLKAFLYVEASLVAGSLVTTKYSRDDLLAIRAFVYALISPEIIFQLTL